MESFTPSRWSDAEVRDPYPVYRDYRAVDPIHQSEPGTWYVFDYAHVAEVLSSRDFVRKAPGHLPQASRALRATVENWLVFMNPPRHTTLRRILSAEISPTTVTRLRPRIAQLVADLASTANDHDSWDVIADFAAPLPILVISELLGVPKTLRDWFRAQAEGLQSASSVRAALQNDHAEKSESAAQALTAYFEEELRSRRGGTDADLVTLLSNHPGIPPDEAVATCIHLLTAGHETTTLLLGKALLALDRNPHLVGTYRHSPDLSHLVDELIRYDSPVQMVTRWPTRDRRLGQRLMRAGDRVIAVLGAANRDPGRFREPDRIEPDRDVSRHVGFGLGIHYCLGAQLARLEAGLGLPHLLALLTGRVIGTVRYSPDLVFHGPEQLTLDRR